MARNREKAQSMLYRFRESQQVEAGLPASYEGRPRNTSDITNVRACERWRAEIVKEVTSKITKIQDASLSEFAVRDLNDEINRLIKEKSHWEWKIRELGGPDYRAVSNALVNKEGRDAPGAKGYKYFGRARELPGVKELFEQYEQEKQARVMTKDDTVIQLDSDYYGYRDEDDGALLKYERGLEEKALKSLNMDAPLTLRPQDSPTFGIPSQKEIEEWIVKKKALALQEKYGIQMSS